ncbi:unnamed protein product [Oreochromis niloticus]|nr:unnamed protein product [Mustela putorius furo]
MEEDQQSDTNATAKDHPATMDMILKELRAFRKDTNDQFNAIRENVDGIGKRLDEAEGRLDVVETRIQASEELLIEMANLQLRCETKLLDLEGRSRRKNLRIYGVKEGEEDRFPSFANFVEVLFEKTMCLSPPTTLGIERAHRAGAKKPPEGAPPRSIVVKLASYRIKEDIIKKAWQARGFDFKDSRIYVDNDYAPEIQRRRKEYAAAKKVLKENNIRFQTPFPAKLRVYYREGTATYNTAHEATIDMVKRGLSVDVVKDRDTLLDQIKQQTWQTSTKKKRGNTILKQGFKERLQVFRHQDDSG